MGRGDHPDGRVEHWLPVVGYEGLYEVSDQGRVWSVPRVVVGKDGRSRKAGGIFLKDNSTPDFRPYPWVMLNKGGRSQAPTIHKLILTAFVGPRPDGMEACHGDGDPSNCVLSNLRWDTHGENNRDQVRHGTNAKAKKIRCKRGHLLRGKNLQPKPAERGLRECKACNLAHSYVSKNPRTTVIAYADKKYQEIVLAGL